MQIRKLVNAPFKNSAVKYRVRMLETRYNTLNTYWMRVLREREEGTYHRDIFKAEMRQKIAAEEARAGTAVGAAERTMRGLYDSYRDALESQTGRKQALDFQAFQNSVVKRAKDFKQQTGVKKVAFKVQVKDGRVMLKAHAAKSKKKQQKGGGAQ